MDMIDKLITNKLQETLGKWISFTCLAGDVFSVRERDIVSMYMFPCADPSGKCPELVHYMVSTVGKDIPVSIGEYMEVAEKLGINTGSLPKVEKGKMGVSNIMSREGIN